MSTEVGLLTLRGDNGRLQENRRCWTVRSVNLYIVVSDLRSVSSSATSPWRGREIDTYS